MGKWHYVLEKQKTASMMAGYTLYKHSFYS